MVVSNRYALSLFEIAKEENKLKEVFENISELAVALSQNDELFNVLASPNINISDKIAILEKIFKDKLEKTLFNFVAILIEKKRIDLFFEIKDEFVAIYNEENNIINAQVITAVEMDKDTENSVLEKLKAETKKEVVLECIIKPEILGGIIIKYNNTLMDGSVKTRLEKLNNTIKQ